MLFAPDIEPKLSRSLSLPFVPLPSGATGPNMFRCADTNVLAVTGPLRAFVGIVNVGNGPSSFFGSCVIGKADALLM